MIAAKRWKRIQTVRAIQRQIAELQLSRCEKDVRNLADLGQRIALIRNSAVASTGLENSTMLRAHCELATRLDGAQAALVAPQRNAAEARDRQTTAVRDAKQREMAVEKIAVSANADAEKSASERQDKSRIFRKTPIRSSGV